MFEEMKKDPAVKLQLASSYAGIANYWKFFDGESKQLLKYHVYEEKQKNEAAFQQWAKGKAEFEPVFTQYEDIYKKWSPYTKVRIYIMEGILGSPLAAYASSLAQLEAAILKNGDIKAAAAAADQARTNFLKDENKPSDQKILSLPWRNVTMRIFLKTSTRLVSTKASNLSVI